MHYVFDSPKDKIVYDVSHQSYPHKMLTGRKDAFLYEEHYDDVSGYSEPDESAHDSLYQSVILRHPSVLHAVLQRAETYAVAKKM